MKLRLERLDDRCTPSAVAVSDSVGPPMPDPTTRPTGPHVPVPQSQYPTNAPPPMRDVYQLPWVGV